jgi:hypothetical protein
MNTKFFYALLVIAIITAACTPVVNVQSTNSGKGNNTPALVPVTGSSTAETVQRDAQVPALWSGEVSSSDNSSPDLKSNINVNTDQPTTAECMSEDSQPRQQSGCTE